MQLRVQHLTHPRRRDLQFELRSPAGRWVTLAEKRTRDTGANLDDWTFLDVYHWGEDSGGTWQLRVSDLTAGSTGSLTGATFTLTAYGSHDAAPTATADAFTVAEDSTTDLDVVANDGDGDGDVLRPTIASPPAHGTATVQLDGRVRYVPDADWSGADSFTYVADDGYLSAAATTATITVTAVPDAPVLTVTAPTDGATYPAGTTTIPVAFTATDADPGQTATLTLTVTDGARTLHAAPWDLTGAPLPAGVYAIRFSAEDVTHRVATAERRVTVLGPRPRILSTPQLWAGTGLAWGYAPVAAPGGGATVTWSGESLPTGMTIVAATGQLQWTPAAAGDYHARIRADDGVGFDLQEMVIHVSTPPIARQGR